MFDADCDSKRLCLFTSVRLLDESKGLVLNLFLRLSSLRLWKRVRALTNTCSAVCLMSLISFWKVVSGVMLARAEYCNDFGQVRLFKCLSSLRIESSVFAILVAMECWSTYFRLIPRFSGCFWSRVLDLSYLPVTAFLLYLTLLKLLGIAFVIEIPPKQYQLVESLLAARLKILMPLLAFVPLAKQAVGCG